ncbi:MAG: DNA topoisomerase 3 [Muribaculaceae bacterium]|nr:DNA topoisomerase 3 [Muribaculaceae bacterium]
MILCITEKPSVGRDIARILGANTRHEGYFEGNGYYVTWTFGHLCSLKEPSDYFPQWKHWAISLLPMIPPRFGIRLIDNDSYKKQFNIISGLILKCDEIINCGDAGQEGELIQRWVMQKAGCDKPVKRLWINSMTDDAIRDGFNNLKPEKNYEPLYLAGLCRAIGDWVLGINATRLYSLKYGDKGQILSIGRVQTPTLALVVNRQLEIENFVPQDYWELKTIYKNVSFSYTGKKFHQKERGEAIINELKKFPLTITEISEKKGKEAPPRLFDLTSLQVECNKKLNLSADDTLKTIQSLYEKKLTTYPRVDTTYLPEDVFKQCGPILNSLSQYQNLLEPLRGKKLLKSKKVFDNSKITDHHAIIPTGQSLPSNLSEKERKVFELIALRFISVFYPDFTFLQTIVTASVDKYNFKATGKTVLDPGWKKVFSDNLSDDEITDDKEDDSILPKFEKGESGPHKPKLVKKTTQPPKPYTEGTLLKAMETAGASVEDEDLREALKANGIGRPSTRAAIIEILYKRGYIVKERKSLKATQAAIDLLSLIHEELLKSAKLTGIWEGKLRKIETGDYSPHDFINEIKIMISEITDSVIKDGSDRRIITSQVLSDKAAAKNSASKKSSRKEKK